MDVIKAVADEIGKARYIVAFTGAGISSESGIPTYRGEGGLWTKYDPNRYANIHYFLEDPSYYWSFFRDVRYPMLKEVTPNRAHLALAEIETAGKLQSVITQNIDGLHQEAGSSTVIELHGTTRTIYCLECSSRYTMEDIFPRLKVQVPPQCPKCGGLLRPDVVFFGESLDSETLDLAYREVGKCDMLIVVGSSLVVYPAADIPVRAKRKDAVLVIINKDSTPMDDLADHVINERAGDVLPQIVRNLKNSGD
ncbi:MAG: NAD-dependent deacylase [Candidatus Aminicenantes bacterium]|nr:NAD-dependent deacylase [Candidatus Aminicenantes bacterium]